MMPPHVVVRDVLDPDTLERLTAIATAADGDYAASRINAGMDEAVRRSRTLPPETYAPQARGTARADRGDVARCVATAGHEAVRCGGVETQLLAYPDGAYYRPHIDTATGGSRQSSDRAVTVVFYSHREPKGLNGGTLRRHAFAFGGADGFVDVDPERNALPLFPAWAMHEVGEVRVASGRPEDNRLAVNCRGRAAR